MRSFDKVRKVAKKVDRQYAAPIKEKIKDFSANIKKKFNLNFRKGKTVGGPSYESQKRKVLEIGHPYNPIHLTTVVVGHNDQACCVYLFLPLPQYPRLNPLSS